MPTLKQDDRFEEEASGFVRTHVEGIVESVLARHLGRKFGSADGARTFDSAVPGVVAVERLVTGGRDDVDWQEAAQEVADETGFGVLAIADCDWSFDDQCDEEATYLAFDVPCLDRHYANAPDRNRISPVEPARRPAP